MGRISTHILDTTRGKPAGGVTIEIFRCDGDERVLLGSAITNADGRTDAPLLSDDGMAVALYELVFHIGSYLRETVSGDAFFETIPLRFRVADAGAHYHVPLLVTPWSYSTYRGS